MTDAEFEKIDAEFIRLLQSGRDAARRRELAARLSRCRDCDRGDPEFYMLLNGLWRQVVPTGRGKLCLDCLARRLGRPLVRADFGARPITKDGATVRLPHHARERIPVMCK